MIRSIPRFSHIPGLLSFILAPFLFPTMAQPVEAAEDEVQIRIVLPTAPRAQAECVLATKDDKGDWRGQEELDVRASFVSDWIPLPREEIGFCTREDGKLQPAATFTVPRNMERALVVLSASQDEGRFDAHVIDGKKTKFGKGQLLLVNASEVTCDVKTGDKETKTPPGKTQVVEPAADGNGMFQLRVSHDSDGNDVVCHDRFVPADENARGYVFMIHDPRMVVRVVTISEFGPFD
jgi:hypothetical protein